MTKDEALKLALEALEKSHTCPLLPDDCAEAITAIKEALEQPEHGWTPERIAGIARLKDAQDKRLAQPSVSVEQEPVAWVYDPITGSITPPQRKPLTDEEIDDIASEHSDEFGMIAPDSWEDFVRAVEAAHGIKGDA